MDPPISVGNKSFLQLCKGSARFRSISIRMTRAVRLASQNIVPVAVSGGAALIRVQWVVVDDMSDQTTIPVKRVVVL